MQVQESCKSIPLEISLLLESVSRRWTELSIAVLMALNCLFFIYIAFERGYWKKMKDTIALVQGTNSWTGHIITAQMK